MAYIFRQKTKNIVELGAGIRKAGRAVGFALIAANGTGQQGRLANQGFLGAEFFAQCFFQLACSGNVAHHAEQADGLSPFVMQQTFGELIIAQLALCIFALVIKSQRQGFCHDLLILRFEYGQILAAMQFGIRSSEDVFQRLAKIADGGRIQVAITAIQVFDENTVCGAFNNGVQQFAIGVIFVLVNLQCFHGQRHQRNVDDEYQVGEHIAGSKLKTELAIRRHIAITAQQHAQARREDARADAGQYGGQCGGAEKCQERQTDFGRTDEFAA